MIDQEVIDDQNYDSNMCAVLVTHSKYDDGLVLDVGASLGFFARNIIRYFPRSRVVSIEPNKSIFDFLCNNVKDLNVIPIQGAVTNGDSEVTFYENYSPNQGVIFKSNYIKYWDNTISNEYKVKGYDFKKLVETLRPNLIKIDIEGYEYFLDYTNLPDSVNTIIMEVHMSDYDELGNSVPSVIDNDLEVYTEIIKTLKNQGFDYINKQNKVSFPWDGTWDGSNQTHIVCVTR